MYEGTAARDDKEAIRVSYIIGTYPILTETFIDREINLLLNRGVDLEVVSIRRPRRLLSPSQRAFSKRVRYLFPVSVPHLIASQLAAAFRRPRTYFGTLFWLVGQAQSGARIATGFHFLTGVYTAWVLRDRHGVHLHAHFVDRAATVALVASRLLQTTYSVTAHAQEIYVEPVLLPERIGNATFAVTCTEYNLRYLTELLGADARTPIVRLYHGLDFQPFRATEERRASKADAVFLLSVAQLWERKGLRYLIEACRLLVDDGFPVHCEIVGEGPLRPALDALIRQLHLADFVILRGALPFPEVVARFQRANAFVLPCIVASDGDRDGIPNVILEAMASGVPVVSTPVSGIPEVVHHEVTGLLVPEGDSPAIADAVARLLADPALVKRITVNGRSLVLQEFDPERNIGALLDLFSHAATGHAASHAIGMREL